MTSFRVETQKVIEFLKCEVMKLEVDNQAKLDRIQQISQRPKQENN